MRRRRIRLLLLLLASNLLREIAHHLPESFRGYRFFRELDMYVSGWQRWRKRRGSSRHFGKYRFWKLLWRRDLISLSWHALSIGQNHALQGARIIL